MTQLSNDARQILRQVVLDNGRRMLEQPDRLKNALDDLFPQRPGEKGALIAGNYAGLPQELTAAGRLTPELKARLIQTLVQDRGQDALTAAWTVETWAFALDVPNAAPAAMLPPLPASPVVPPPVLDPAREVKKAAPNPDRVKRDAEFSKGWKQVAKAAAILLLMVWPQIFPAWPKDLSDGKPWPSPWTAFGSGGWYGVTCTIAIVLLIVVLAEGLYKVVKNS